MLVEFLIFFLIPIFKFFYPYIFKGTNNLNKINGGFIICSNHISNLDAIFISIAIKRKIFFLAKSELFKNKLISALLSKLGAIPVKRGENDVKAIVQAENILKNKNILGIFIEGTRSKSGNFLRPKSGAAILACKTNSVVIPVCITPFDGKKIKIFKTTVINFGEPIQNIKFSQNSYKEIRMSTEKIMNEIIKLKNV